MSEMSEIQFDVTIDNLAREMAENLYTEDPTPDVVFSKACRLNPDVVCEKLVDDLLLLKNKLGISDDVVFSEFQYCIAEKNLVILNIMLGNKHVLRLTKERLTADLQSSLVTIFKSILEEK